MEHTIYLTTFGLIFLAGKSMVFVSSTPALWGVSLLEMFAGKQRVRFIPLCRIHRTTGFMFLVFGVLRSGS